MNNKERRSPTVYIIDDNYSVRSSISWLVEQIGLKAKAYASAQDFLDKYDSSSFGCLVLDIRMPAMSGLELQDKLNSLGATLPVIIITGHGDVPVTVRAMKAGAYDFLQKPFNDQVLIDKINEAIREHESILNEIEHKNRSEQMLSSLTQRELDVLSQLKDGKTSKMIANNLGISVRTVEGHRAKIMHKLEAKTTGQLISMVSSQQKDY